MTRRLFRLLAVVLLTLTACSGHRGTESGATPSPNPAPAGYGEADAGDVDWAHPVDTTTIQSRSDAQAAVDFEIVQPPALGTPTSFAATPPGDDPHYQVAVLHYESTEYGVFNVFELKPQIPASAWDHEVQATEADSHRPNVHGSVEVVTLPGSTLKALITTGFSSDIEFLVDEGRLEIWISGPSLTRDEVIALGTVFTSGASPSEPAPGASSPGESSPSP